MVIDNADNNSEFFETDEELLHLPLLAGSQTTLKKLAAYVPSCTHGSILVTSRNKEAAVNFAIQKARIEVKKMSDEESKDLLSRILTEGSYSQDDLEHLGSLLDYLPLALVQAAAYIEAQSCSIAIYIAMFNESKDSALKLLSKGFATEGRDQDIPNAVALSWMLSFDQIRQHNPRAANLLSLMAFFDRQAIPESILKDANETSLSFTGAIGQLLAFSLITRNTIPTQYNVHRLAYLISQAWQIKNGLENKWSIVAQQRLLERSPKDNYTAWETCALYLPHAQAMINEELGKSSETYNRNINLLMSRVGSYLSLRGFYYFAEGIDTQCLDYCKRWFDLEHLDTLTSMANMASTYQNQGRWKETEELKVQVLEKRKRVLGQEHPYTLTSMANLALTYRNQGRSKEAEELGVQVLEKRKSVVGQEHPDTLVSMSNLAFTWKDYGRHAEAIKLLEGCVRLRTQILGADHHLTLSSITTLQGWQTENLEISALIDEDPGV
jgi:hypothetical protein